DHDGYRAGVTTTVVLAAVSFGYATWLHGANQPLNYYDTGARAWQILLGGLLGLAAAAGASRLRISGPPRRPAGQVASAAGPLARRACASPVPRAGGPGRSPPRPGRWGWRRCRWSPTGPTSSRARGRCCRWGRPH